MYGTLWSLDAQNIKPFFFDLQRTTVHHTNPILCFVKFHINQNEKLVMHSATHIYLGQRHLKAPLKWANQSTAEWTKSLTY